VDDFVKTRIIDCTEKSFSQSPLCGTLAINVDAASEQVHKGKQADRQKERNTEGHTDRQIERQTDRWRDS
jgi:hypothetical protein